MKAVAVLPGDGIGAEVVSAVLPVLERMGLPLDFRHGEVGWASWCATGDAVPPATWRLLAETDTCLLGAVTSKPVREAEAELAEGLRGTGLGYVSPVVRLRQRLALYANVRPIVDLRAGRFDFVVIRENTEGLYSGLDFHGAAPSLWELVGTHPNAALSGPADTSVTLRLQTSQGVDRLLRFGFSYARRHGYRRLTVVDKPNVLRASGNHLRARLELVAADHPDVEAEILNVDAVALWMVRRPERFGVVVAENMFGDILSDVGAGVMGGLGLAPSGNIGDNGSYFEPVHGSAPAMAGRGRANPMALLLTAAQLLRYLDMPAPAEQIRAAVRAVIRSGRTVTYDLGGTATTGQAAEAVAAAMARTSRDRQASVVAVGDELLSGTVTDTNGDEISALLGEHGYRVRARLIVGDTLTDITDAVRCRLGVDDVVAVIGGLGPTSDDRTRDAVAAACGLRLEHRETAWQAVRHRLESFNLTVHEANRRQALFPAGCGLLPNGNGTAWGARIELATTTVLMLPGPPRECLPMARSAIADLPRGQRSAVTTWRLLGVMESDVATDVDEVLRPVADQVGVSYLWRPPYVDVTVRALSESDSVPLPPSLERLLARHTVSRRGLDAFGELAAAPHFHLSAVDLGFAGEEFAAGLRRAGVAAIGEVGGPQGPALSLTGRAVFSGGGVGCFGSVRLTSEVAGGGRTRVFHLVVPNRGPEVAECAAAFFAWSVARTLAEATS